MASVPDAVHARDDGDQRYQESNSGKQRDSDELAVIGFLRRSCARGKSMQGYERLSACQALQFIKQSEIPTPGVSGVLRLRFNAIQCRIGKYGGGRRQPGSTSAIGFSSKRTDRIQDFERVARQPIPHRARTERSPARREQEARAAARVRTRGNDSRQRPRPARPRLRLIASRTPAPALVCACPPASAAGQTMMSNVAKQRKIPPFTRTTPGRILQLFRY